MIMTTKTLMANKSLKSGVKRHNPCGEARAKRELATQDDR